MKMHYRNTGFISLLFCITLVLTSCGDDPAPAKVTGTITLAGVPVPGAEIVFVPDNGARTSYGSTDSAGRYELRFTPRLKGAAVGTHRVTIQTGPSEPSTEPDDFNVPETIPARYNSASELTATLKSGKK